MLAQKQHFFYLLAAQALGQGVTLFFIQAPIFRHNFDFFVEALAQNPTHNHIRMSGFFSHPLGFLTCPSSKISMAKIKVMLGILFDSSSN